MITKALGILDILAALIFLINLLDKSNSWFPNKLVLIAGVYLLLKGLIFIFSGDFFASSLDVICAIIILSSIWLHIPFILAAIVIVFIIQKGAFSLLG